MIRQPLLLRQNLVHSGAASFAFALQGIAAVFHRDLLRVFHLSFCFTFYAIGFLILRHRVPSKVIQGKGVLSHGWGFPATSRIEPPIRSITVRSTDCRRLAEKLESGLRIGVSLSEHRNRRTGQNIISDQLAAFFSHVRITDTAVGFREVFSVDT